jgi:hypothetical protein
MADRRYVSSLRDKKDADEGINTGTEGSVGLEPGWHGNLLNRTRTHETSQRFEAGRDSGVVRK